MNIRSVYCCATYEDAARVCAIHERLRHVGVAYTSRWAQRAAEPSIGADDLASLTTEQIRALATDNDLGIARADAVLVLAREKAGGEMFCELRFALTLGIPVYWVGRRILSSWRENVILCEDLDDALTRIASSAAPRRGRRNP